jgi:hypothetical protein
MVRDCADGEMTPGPLFNFLSARRAIFARRAFGASPPADKRIGEFVPRNSNGASGAT